MVNGKWQMLSGSALPADRPAGGENAAGAESTQ